MLIIGSFGFVNFVDHEAARTASDELNDTDFKGKRIFVGRAQKRSERDEELRKTHEVQRIENEAKSAGVNLYVKNLDGEFLAETPDHYKRFADEWDDDRLRAEFDSFGTITSCKVMKDENATSRVCLKHYLVHDTDPYVELRLRLLRYSR